MSPASEPTFRNTSARAQARANEELRQCEKCAAPLGSLIIGGVGDWKQTILCERCFHVRRGVPIEAIFALAAEQLDVPVEAIKQAQADADEQWYALLARHSYG